MSLLATSLSLVFALGVGVFLGFRFCMRFFVRKLQAGFDRMLGDPRNRSTVTSGWLLDRIHDRIREGATIDELHDWVHEEQDRVREATAEQMRRALAEEGILLP